MSKFLLILICSSISVNVFAQNVDPKTGSRPDSIGYYMVNETTMAYSESTAKFVRLLIKTDSNMFRVNDYYMDGTQKLVAKTTIDSLNFLPGARGICYEYFPNGKRKSIKNFENGKLTGDAISYYPNGNVYNIIAYSGKDVFLKECHDSIGKMLCENGYGKWIDFDSSFKSKTEGPVADGKREGEWTETTSDAGNNKGVYKNGILVSGNLLANDTATYKSADVPPAFDGGDSGFNRFLAKNIRYPAIARENRVQGRVIISFTVEKDGAITDLRIVRGIGSGCDEEVMRVISLSPLWKPGLKNGKPVRVKYAVPVAFALQEEKSKIIPDKSSRGF